MSVKQANRVRTASGSDRNLLLTRTPTVEWRLTCQLGHVTR